MKQPGEWALRAVVAEDVIGQVLDQHRVYIISSETDARVSKRVSPNRWFPHNTSGGRSPQETDLLHASEMMVSGEPGLNDRIEITYTVTAAQDLTMVQIGIITPPRGWKALESQMPPIDKAIKEQIGGSDIMVWSGSLQADESIQITGLYQITQVGRGGVFGFLRKGYINEDGKIVLQTTVTEGIYFRVNHLVSAFEALSRENP